MESIFFIIFRRMRAPLLALILVYTLALLGFVLIPGQDADGNVWHMSWFHAFYVLSYTATTIGFGEIPYAFTDAQRLWMTFCVYASVVAWLYSIGSLLALLRDRALQRGIEERRFSRRVGALTEPFYLICGYGQTGGDLVRALTDNGQRVVVLDNNPERIDHLSLEPLRQAVPALRADVRRPDTLLMAGLRHPQCAGVLALTASNEANLKVALAAKLMHPGAKVICRADNAAVEANMASFGTDHIYNPFDIFALYLATALQAPCLTLLHDWLTANRDTPPTEPRQPPTEGLWLLCGYGRFGKAIYPHLVDHGLEVVVIEPAPERTGQPGGRLVRGNGTEAATLEEAGIERAVGLIAGSDSDANNLSIVMTAKALRPRLFTVVRQNQVINAPLFAAVGANILMHPSLIVAERIRTLLGSPLLTEFLNAARFGDDSEACALVARILALMDDLVPDVWEARLDQAGAPALWGPGDEGREPVLGDLLRDPRDRDQTLRAIVLMRRRGSQITPLPELSERIRDGDRLLFCGQPLARRRMQWTLHNINALNYVMTGEAGRTGPVWRWWAARRRHKPRGATGGGRDREL